MKKRLLSVLLMFCMVWTMLPVTAAAYNSVIATDTATNPMYTVSYNQSAGGTSEFLAPTVSGTANAPTLTFTRNLTQSSGGVITSKYTMDFTRSFNITGSVSFAERDGVSFALHTTQVKRSFFPNYNTCMMAPDILNHWDKSLLSRTVTSSQNDITNGLLWDFMQFESSRNSASNTRFYAGAYSYRITNGTTVTALPDDAGKIAAGGTDAALGILHHGTKNQSGDFRLGWVCTDASKALGNLTISMGAGTTFTYTGLDGSAVFGGLDKAKAVYFSFSTYLPLFNSATDVVETGSTTQISIANAYYTDTAANGKSTVSVESAYYCDADGDGSYETEIGSDARVSPGSTILCRNTIRNKNALAAAPLSTALLLLSLRSYAEGDSTGTPVGVIANQKLFWHAAGAAAETDRTSDLLVQKGTGPLNSTQPNANYAAVTLPAGGDGQTAYNDACAVYEYTFTPDKSAVRIAQTIQIGVEPFIPAVAESAVPLITPTAAEYLGARGAEEGADYTVDGEAAPKTLVIKTAGGAAWWNVNSADYLDDTVMLDADIDVGGFLWTPVGDSAAAFAGTFDGQGHALGNLTVTEANGGNAGVFGYIDGGTVENLAVSGSIRISGGVDGCAGGIAGFNDGGLLDRCSSSAAISLTTTGTAKSCAGGIAGENSGGVIRNCQNSGAVAAVSEYLTRAGGIAGEQNGGAVQNCFNTGAVSAEGGSSKNHAGGIAGDAYGSAAISNCYSAGNAGVSGQNGSEDDLGGVCGKISGALLNCFWMSKPGLRIIGTAEGSAAGCGAFTDNSGALTAGTEESCGSPQTLAAYAANLLAALNGWVTVQASGNFRTWNAAAGVNNGFPVFGGVLSITPVITVTAEGKSYDGSAIAQPGVSGNLGGGTVSWSFSGTQNGAYSSGLPADAGTWYVKAHVAASGVYTEADSEPVRVEIRKAGQPVPAAGTGYTISCTEETITADGGCELSADAAFGVILAAGAAVTPGGTYYVRRQADSNHNAGDAAQFTVQLRPAIGTTLRADTRTETVAVPAGYSYQSGSGGAVSVTQTKTLALAPGASLTYWKTATQSAFRSEKTELTAPERLAKPGAPAVSGAAETLATTAAMQYQLGNGDWTACTAGMVLSGFGWTGSAADIRLRLAATDENYASDSISVTLPARAAAPGASKTDETVSGRHDGRITGVTDLMEYRKTGAAGWTAITGESVEGLEPGIYSVRIKAAADAVCSLSAELTIAAGETLRLSFDEKGGSEVDDIENIGWHQTVTPPVTARAGHTFVGWFTAENGGTELLASTKTEASAVYFARWKANTYTVTFHPNFAGSADQTVSQTHTYDTAQRLTENAFARADCAFSCWNTETDGSGTAYADGQSVLNLLSAQDANLDLYVQWTENTRCCLTGAVTDDGAPAAPVSGADVRLKQGETVAASTVTDSAGRFTFANLLPGVYNLVVTKGRHTATALCAIDKSDAAEIRTRNVTLPTASSNDSILKIVKDQGIGELPKVVVGGLDELAENLDAGISMTVTQKSEDQRSPEQAVIMAASGEQNIGIYLDVTLGRNGAALSDAGRALEIVVPFDFSGRTGVNVWRCHGAGAEKFTSLRAKPAAPYADRTFYADRQNGLLYIYAEKFSLYAVSYTWIGSAAAYPVSIDASGSKNGALASSHASASAGTRIVITAKPDAGYRTGRVSAADSSGRQIDVADNGGGTYSFFMPKSGVTVSAVFVKTGNPFADVPESAYYCEAVLWAADRGVTKGKAAMRFDPDGVCTRAQAVTFLWRAMGRPEPESTACPFADVAAGAYYYKAVLWAAEKGIALGTGSAAFSPDDTVTRGQAVTFLHRAAGKPAADTDHPFKDVAAGAYCEDAAAWAAARGIARGTGSAGFSPAEPCTRAQIVTFLWRWLGK